jgi:hypothetical protein
MSRIDANDRKFYPMKLVPKPVRHRAGLTINALRKQGKLVKQVGQSSEI